MKHLRKHISEVHKDYKPFICKHCPAKFYQGGHLTRKPFHNLNLSHLQKIQKHIKRSLFDEIEGLFVHATHRIL